MKVFLNSVIFLLLLTIGVACQSITPPIGTLTINSDTPFVYQGKIDLGVTLGGKSQYGIDLLQNNLLFNGGFELAAQLDNCVFNTEKQSITTPNGFTTYYPLVSYHAGWEVINGTATIETHPSKSLYQGHYLSLSHTSDSTVFALLYGDKSPLQVEIGDTLALSLLYRLHSSELPLSFFIADSTHHPISTEITLPPAQEWRTTRITLVVSKSCDHAHLTLRLSNKGRVDIDNLRLTPHPQQTKHALATPLVELLQSLAPSYIRYPEGRIANGFFTGTYPIWDSNGRAAIVPIAPLWTTTQQEFAYAFSLQDLLTLSADLKAQPMIVTNIGITDPTASPRSEGIKELDNRIDQLAQLAKNLVKKQKKNDSLTLIALQLGYDMNGQDYSRRFYATGDRIRQDTIPIDLISSADLTIDKRYSNYKYDASGTTITSPNVSALIPEVGNFAASLRQPILLSECHFDYHSIQGKMPPLTLVASFLIDCERNTAHIKALSITPLLGSSTDAKSLPLIIKKGVRYTPTHLYHLYKLFNELRGDAICALNDSLPSHTIKPLYTSLTASQDRNNYYLKAANTTRHPLTYRIAFKGKEFEPGKMKIYRLTPLIPVSQKTIDSLQYAITTEEQSVHSLQGVFITFQPYEIVIIHFSN